jgi:hypothetical protein
MTEAPSRVAIHEGAHAVAALALGLRVRYATVRPCALAKTRGSVLGAVEVSLCPTAGHVYVDPLSPDEDWEPEVVTTLAGAAAEHRQFGDSQLCGYDVQHAHLVVLLLNLRCARQPRRTFTDAEVDAATQPYRVKAERVVSDHWPWIGRVAAALDERVGLLGDEIENLR